MKKAIIAGATSGIGRGLALILAENNYRVGITGRREELLAELKDLKPDSFIAKTHDVNDLTTTIEILEELTLELGGLDLLIISSGTGNINENLIFEIEKRAIETNVLGFTIIADWAFNLFKIQKSGHLVVISSIGGLRGNRRAPSYNATKAYQMNYMEALRQCACHLKYPIFITDIRPGFVDTAMAKSEEKFWVASVEKASRQIYSAIKKGRDVAYITKRWRLIAIIIRLIPSFVYNRI